MCSETVARRAGSGLPRPSTYSFASTSFLWSLLPVFYLREQASSVPSFLMGAPPKLTAQHDPKEFGASWCSPVPGWNSKGQGPESSQWQKYLWKAQDEFPYAHLHQSMHAGRISLRNTQWDVQDQTLKGMKHCYAVTFDLRNIVNTCSWNGNCWNGVMSVVLWISIIRF